MNYFVDYKELPLSFPEVPLQRLGGIHKESSPVINSKKTDNEFDIVNDVNEKETAIRDVINTLLAEYDNTIVSYRSQIQMRVDEINTLTTNSDEEKEDMKMYWDALEQLIPLLMTSEFKTGLINDIKQIN